MALRLFAIVCLFAAGCSKASPPGGGPDADDDRPDARENPDAADEPDAAPHVDAPLGVPDATPGTPDAPPSPPDATPPPPDATPPPVAITLSQTVDNTTVLTETGGAGTTHSAACANSFGVSAENKYERVYVLAEHGVTGPLTVNQVSIGVETAFDEPPSGTPAATYPATINFYTYTGAIGSPLVTANMSLFSSTPITIPNNTLTTVLSFAVNTTVPANSQFIVELAIPDGDPDNDTYGEHFYIGSNEGGQTRSAYIRAPECTINDPTTLASIGFANMHVILNVTGTYQP